MAAYSLHSPIIFRRRAEAGTETTVRWCWPRLQSKRLWSLPWRGFDIADQYRIPVLLLGDGMLGQMMEPVEFGTLQAQSESQKTMGDGRYEKQTRTQYN